MEQLQSVGGIKKETIQDSNQTRTSFFESSCSLNLESVTSYDKRKLLFWQF